MNDYIAKSVKEQLANAVKDRDLLELESSIKVFDKAWGWFKTIGGIAGALVVVAGAGVVWKVTDFWSSVEVAKQSVVSTSTVAKSQMDSTSSKSLREINEAAQNTRQAIGISFKDVTRQVSDLRSVAHRTKGEISQQAKTLTTEVANSRLQLEAASKLEPEMRSMQGQLQKAVEDISRQQQTLSKPDHKTLEHSSGFPA